MLAETDLALVDALQENPRAPWSLLARALGVTPDTATRRWHRLLEQRSAWLVAHPGSTLTGRMVLAFVEVNCAAGRPASVAEQLLGDPHVYSIDHMTAHCDLLLHMVAGSLSEIFDYVVHRVSTLPGVVNTRTLVATRLFSEGSRWRVRAISPEQRKTMAAPPRPPRQADGFTDLDRRLLLCLGEHVRAPYAELAERVGTSASTVRRRTGALLASDAIRLRCEIAREQSPSPTSVVLWMRAPPDRLETTARSLAMLSEVRLCASVSGSANLLVVVWLHSANDLVALESALVSKLTRSRSLTGPLCCARPS